MAYRCHKKKNARGLSLPYTRRHFGAFTEPGQRRTWPPEVKIVTKFKNKMKKNAPWEKGKILASQEKSLTP